MLLSLEWLRDYFQKPDVKISPSSLSEKLTMRGLAVASYRKVGTPLENVVVGQIEKIEKHPNADRLQVTQVVISEGPDAPRRTIVCGAKNIAEGDKVPVALPGCVLPGDVHIKVASVRGVESSGMICSAKELGIVQEPESEGILQLPKHSQLGSSVARLLGHKSNDDILMEFELTPNRRDCMSVLGLAREIAPIVGTQTREPKPSRFRISPHRTSSIIKIEVEDSQLCPRYVGRVIDGLKVTESPDWMRMRLEAVGIRPINNIVDITNFVMLEYGQPLHAFDLRKIESGTVHIGPCKNPSEMTLLNGQTVALEPGDIVIWDGERPVALAGIMGGANSQIEPDTTSILLESAAFLSTQIRKTAKRLGLSTDSSKRFEKGNDLLAVAAASERAAGLLRDLFEGNVYHPPTDSNENAATENNIAIDMREVRKISGLNELAVETACNLLEQIEIPSTKRSVNVLQVRVPSFRSDITSSIDIVEEITRLYGYEGIHPTYPNSAAAYERFDESAANFEDRSRKALAALGMREVINYSFTSEDAMNKYGMLSSNSVRIRNPISEEMKVLRPSLLPALLQTYSHNFNRQIKNQRIFEVANIYEWNPQSPTQVRETPFIAGLLSGSAQIQSWKSGSEEPVNFFHAKGIVEGLIRKLTTVYPTYELVGESKVFHPRRAASIQLGTKKIGAVGELHPFIQNQLLETTEPVLIFELNLEALRKYERTGVKYIPPSKFPAKQLDIALLVDSKHSCREILETIRSQGGSDLAHVELFDLYEGEKVQKGSRSLAFRLVFQSDKRTLLDNDVNTSRDKILHALSDRFNAQQR